MKETDHLYMNTIPSNFEEALDLLEQTVNAESPDLPSLSHSTRYALWETLDVAGMVGHIHEKFNARLGPLMDRAFELAKDADDTPHKAQHVANIERRRTVVHAILNKGINGYREAVKQYPINPDTRE